MATGESDAHAKAVAAPHLTSTTTTGFPLDRMLPSKVARSWRKVAVAFSVLLAMPAALALQPPTTTSGTIVSAYGDTVCDDQEVVVPKSTTEVSQAIKYYYQLQQGPKGVPVKLRVVTRARNFPAADGYRILGFHDRSTFACAAGSAPGTKTVTMLMQNMRDVQKAGNAIVRVQAGITVTELTRFATSQGLTVPLGVLPGYADLTIGGLLATGGHGFGGKGSSNVADIVTHIKFVDGTGKIRQTARSSNIGRGLAGGLGMLGVITEVTLQLQPGLGKTRSWGTGIRSDANMAAELLGLWSTYDHMLVYWRPDLKMYRAVITEEAAADAPFDPPFISDSQTPTGCFVKPAPDASLQFAGQIHVSMTLDVPNLNISNQACNGFGSYILNPSQFGWVLTFKDTGAGIAPVVTDNATGLTNQMQSCDCDVPGSSNTGQAGCSFDAAVWQRIWQSETAQSQPLTPSYTLEESEFALNRRNLTAFIEDGKAMANTLLPGTCWPGDFLIMRTGGPTSDHIGPQSGSKSDRFMWVEYGQFRPNIPLTSNASKPRIQKKASALQEFFEQLMVCKYKARPHWGKSWPRLFTQQACPIKDLYQKFSTQLDLQKMYDPTKMFEPSMLTSLIAGGVPNPGGAYCTNELSCYCKIGQNLDCGNPGLCCKKAPAPLPLYNVCLPC